MENVEYLITKTIDFFAALMHAKLPAAKTYRRANLVGTRTCGVCVMDKTQDKCLPSLVLAPFTPRSHA